MAAVQMNVRIERELKAEGDAAFQGIGYTPTEIVREMWSFAKRNRHDPQKLQDMVDSLGEPQAAEAARDARMQRHKEYGEWVERGQSVVADACACFGIDTARLQPASSEYYDELLAQALEEDDMRARTGK